MALDRATFYQESEQSQYFKCTYYSFLMLTINDIGPRSQLQVVYIIFLFIIGAFFVPITLS